MWNESGNRRARLLFGVFVLTCGVAGCDELSTGGEEFPTVERLEILPADPVVYTSSEVASPIQFMANVFWTGGDITENATVTWASSNQTAGTITSSGLFTPNTSSGGITLITAGYIGIKASTTLTVVYTRDILETGLSSSLPAQVDNAAVETDATRAPFLLYPYDGVIVPRNLAKFEVQWTPAPERPLTVLEFSSATTLTRIFSLSDRFVPSYSVWQSIAATNSGGEFTLRASSGVLEGEGESATLVGPLVQGTAPIRVGISRLDATGSIYYWSIKEFSIKQIAYGATAAKDFFTPGPEEGGCVSCHTLSPQGDRMAVVYPDPAGSGHRLGILALSAEDPPVEVQSFSDAVSGGRGSFTPDGRYYLGVDDGRASLYDGRTGRYLQPVDLGFDRVENVVFSPEGDEVAFTVPQSFRGDTQFYQGRIATAPFQGSVFGAASWVTPKVEGTNQYYPAYSPDGAWIAYNQSRHVGDDAPEGDSLMDLTSQVYLVPRGGGTPVLLKALGEVDEARLGPPPTEATPPPGEGVEGFANSLPVWGPLPDADLLWLSFSTMRGYGHDVAQGIPQIWISAVDPSLAELGQDPSSRPFWLPLQDPTTHNHIPQWGPF